MSVRLVDRETLKPNNYNPNTVLDSNLELLTQSILTNGWTLPIVVTADLVIIDGFHRWTVSGREPLRSRLAGPDGAIMVPVVTVDHDDQSKNVYGTITHNRARGVHQLGPMKAIVKGLLDAGKTTKEIGRELGMKEEEIFRLSDFDRETFLKMMAQGTIAYSPAAIFQKV